MAHYINKDAIVAEIERKIQNIDYEGLSDRNIGQEQSLYHILSFLDTLEVKEVDLEKEVDSQMDLLCNLLCYMEELSNGDFEGVYPFPVNVNEDLQRFAKHFYELGLKATQKGE